MFAGRVELRHCASTKPTLVQRLVFTGNASNMSKTTLCHAKGGLHSNFAQAYFEQGSWPMLVQNMKLIHQLQSGLHSPCSVPVVK